MMEKLPKEYVCGVANALFDYYDLDVPYDQIESILMENDFHENECKEVQYSDVDTGTTLDTCVREVALEDVCLSLFGQNPPCYGDSEEVKQKFATALFNYKEAKGGK